MKKILILLLGVLLLASCSTTYYVYYEVETLELANIVSMQDAAMARNRKSPSRLVAAYPDSTGRTIYLMETLTKEKLTYDEDEPIYYE